MVMSALKVGFRLWLRGGKVNWVISLEPKKNFEKLRNKEVQLEIKQEPKKEEELLKTWKKW
jgi:hypothetical protein